MERVYEAQTDCDTEQEAAMIACTVNATDWQRKGTRMTVYTSLPIAGGIRIGPEVKRFTNQKCSEHFKEEGDGDWDDFTPNVRRASEKQYGLQLDWGPQAVD